MRLLDTTTGRFKWFPDPRAIRYAILSHVWAKPDRKNPAKYRPEQTYEEIVKLEQDIPLDQPILDKLSPKIQGACKIAREHDFNYIWIDSGCIDKSSSAELSEAINSMFEWYRHANICYALLEDVEEESIARAERPTSSFRNSKWFKRGWTLQELLAPRNVLFLSRLFKVIGTKAELADVIADVTFIRREVLLDEFKLEDAPVSERMSWASRRETTREEDEAYCLLGIFGIQMSPIYGEGRYAFIRLQEEILRQTADPTILTWGGWITRPYDYFSLPTSSLLNTDSSQAEAVVSDDSDTARSYLLALSPRDFESHSATVAMTPQSILPNFDIYSTDFAFTAHGIRAKLPLMTIYDKNKKPYRLALLGCQDKKGRCIALLLQWRRSSAGHRSVSIGAFLRDTSLSQSGPGRSSGDNVFFYRLLALEVDDIRARAEQFQLQDICIPHRVPPSLRQQTRDEDIHALLEVYRQETVLSLAGWCHPLLKKRGFTVLPDPESYTSEAKLHEFGLLELSDPQRNEIKIQVGLCTREECLQKGLLQATVIAPRTPPAVGEPGSPSSDRPQCHDFHIASWIPQNCVASKTFPIITAKGDAHTLRLTLRLKSEPGKKFYVLEIELLDPLKGRLPASPPRSLTAMLDAPPAVTFSEIAPGRRDDNASSEGSRVTTVSSPPPPYPPWTTNSSGLGLEGLPAPRPDSVALTVDRGYPPGMTSDSRVVDSGARVSTITSGGTLNAAVEYAPIPLPGGLPSPIGGSNVPNSSMAGTALGTINGNSNTVTSTDTAPNAVSGGSNPFGTLPSNYPPLDSNGAALLPTSAPNPTTVIPANAYSGISDIVPSGLPNSVGNVQNLVGSHPNVLMPGFPPPHFWAAYAAQLYGGMPNPLWGAVVNAASNPYAAIANSVAGASSSLGAVSNLVNGFPSAPNVPPITSTTDSVPNQSLSSGTSPVTSNVTSPRETAQEGTREKKSSPSFLRWFRPLRDNGRKAVKT